MTTTEERTPLTRRAGVLPRGRGYGTKRLLLGRPLPTAELEHERLGKITALAIFSSDALSSVAYATQEMLITLFLAGAAMTAAFNLVVPLSLVIVGVLTILIFSYRQTIRAYPSAGGAYIVTKDNFGLLPAQVAGVALLTDYVLTVAVSVSAGVAAIIAALPDLAFLRVPLAVAFIVALSVGNLRGVKESGRLFAAPTYVFIAIILTMIGLGLAKWATDSLTPAPDAAAFAGGWLEEAGLDEAAVLAAIPLGVALHALASGSAAMTGVEAISNGVPAFRKPEWRNARTTLTCMGVTLGTMFLGISFLAQEVQAVPDPEDTITVLASIGRAIFGPSSLGEAAFYLLQAATMLILILAANTAFADFPRLANFHADDAFLPRQFTTRGHRLVFSNGIIALAAAAIVLVVVFRADVTLLIPFYAIGVFTSFSLSQAGMARRHLRLREPGWRTGLAINALGSIATAMLLVVIGVTKFMHGAWAVIVLVPVLVWLLVRMNRQYDRERLELERGVTAFTSSPAHRKAPTVILVVDDVDPKTVHALQYARTLRTDRVVGVHLEDERATSRRVEDSWRLAGLGEIPLRIVRGKGEDADRLAGFIGGFETDRDITVVMPVPQERGWWERLSAGRAGARLTRALLPYDHVRVTLVRDHPDGVHPLQRDEQGRPVVRLHARALHTVVVLIDRLDNATVRSLGYALSLGASSVRAVHAAADLDKADVLVQRWSGLRVPVPLDVVECWDRDVARTVERYVLDEQRGDGAEITVVMARRDFPSLGQRLLHDRTSRKIQAAMGRYPHVDVADVPFYMQELDATLNDGPEPAPLAP